MASQDQIKEIRKKEDRKEERTEERKEDKKKVNPFFKKKEAAASGRWATIQHDLNTENVFQKESSFKKYPLQKAEAFFTKTPKKKPSKKSEFSLEKMQKDFPALKKSEK